MSEESFLQSISFALEAALKQAVPVDTGELKNSISVKPTNEGLQVNMAEHAVYVEFGTAPHVIRAKPGGVLAFPRTGSRRVTSKDGKVSGEFTFGGKTIKTDAVFAKQVYHPGTQPQPFIRNTMYHKFSQIVERAALLHLDEDVVVEVKYNDFDFRL
jgi:hypothetical protein